MVERLKMILDPELRYVKKDRVAAVLVPITFDFKLVMIKRAKNLSRSAGHIAFPGGIRESAESIVETALREAEEEIGVEREKINVLGYLSPKEVVEHRIKIHPVVGIVNSKNFKPDNYEVEKILVDDLRRVLKSRRITDWGPNFECSRELVWGASSRILDDFYLRIVKKFGSVDNFFSPEFF